jgi:hypothetical protein
MITKSIPVASSRLGPRRSQVQQDRIAGDQLSHGSQGTKGPSVESPATCWRASRIARRRAEEERADTPFNPVLEARLSALVASARSLVTGVTLPVWQTVGRFFTVVLPAGVYRARAWWITIGVINIALGAAGRLAGDQHPGLTDSLLSDDEVKQLVDHDFAQ